MDEPSVGQAPPEGAKPAITLEAGTYEVLRGRLGKAGEELRNRLETLNAARQAIFGAIPTSLLATVRITTGHNCVPRDMAPLGGGKFLFGYNVFIGLKTETVPKDVFAAYEKQGNDFYEVPLDFINDPNFLNDFRSLYRYYRDAFFAKFSSSGNCLYMVFQTSPKPEDIKSFKWESTPDGLAYRGNRFDHEVKSPPQHGFEWARTTRDMHRRGPHPHISIQDRVFVETVEGDLTIKVEDNTLTGAGIYSEPVDHADQTLDDAEIFYAAVGHLILLKIRPYQEKNFRYLAFNEKMREVRRIDAMAEACVLLPEDHGIIFSNGYYLQLGSFKEFPTEIKGMRFEQRRSAPNGEDYLYVFFNPAGGDYILLSYNVITQQVATPIHCNGYCFFEDGELAFFQSDNTPQKHHAIQVWQTPYLDHNSPPPTQTDAYLFKVGNQAIVRAMAECQELLSLINKEDSYVGLFVDTAKRAGDLIDSYFWLDRPEAYNLREVIQSIRETAGAAVDEFAKVVKIRQSTAQATAAVAQRSQEITEKLKAEKRALINDFIEGLTRLREVRGEILGLKELRYADAAQIERLNQEVVELTGKISRECVSFLLDPTALQPYLDEIRAHGGAVETLAKATVAKTLEGEIEKTAQGLVLLTETVNSLPSEDATETTRILESISGVYGEVNQVKAQLKRKRQKLQEVEGAQLFAAQVRLLDQSLASLLDSAATPQLCDGYLNRLMVQFQEAEAKFADADVFLEKLTEKREEFCSAFATRKSELVQARNARTESLFRTGERLLKGLAQRLQSQSSVNALEAFYASDPMAQRVQELVEQLTKLEDPIKAGDLQTRMQTVKQEALHQLRDRLELYAEGDQAIRFGIHRFRVQSQELEATIIQRDGQLLYHLTGTGFYEPVNDPIIEDTKPVWAQEVESENQDVYRAEYLAYQLFRQWQERGEIAQIAQLPFDALVTQTQEFMVSRYSEGYARGVHDQDGAQILSELLRRCNRGLAGYPSPAKAVAGLFWQVNAAQHERLIGELKGLKPLGEAGRENAQKAYGPEMEQAIKTWLDTIRLFPGGLAKAAAHFLIEVLTGDISPAGSQEAQQVVETFETFLDESALRQSFADAIRGLAQDPVGAFRVARQWLNACPRIQALPHIACYIDEASLRVAQVGKVTNINRAGDGPNDSTIISGMRGDHPRLTGGAYSFHYHQFRERLDNFSQTVAPHFRRYQKRRTELCAELREKLRLEGLKSHVLTSFVRNQLIDQCYLPLVGANLAKQIGTADSESRTDRMGLLLLISPPGYGKTTLMEYVANRLGLVFLKINGPTLGTKVTSLDPAEAPNAAAREEIVKLNLGLEMGDNVMLYVDDIQHCHAEFLQKFISLCDGQRQIEGVWQGRPRTYNFRGKRVAVVMAGNPYTESGTRFQIPDMLANRADTYNLGEIIANKAETFHLSYLENALGSCPALAKLRRHPKDFLSIVRMVENNNPSSDLEGSYTAEELSEFIQVTRKLTRIRSVLLRINEEYIRSAAQADEHREEPAFRLQGSYRNMARLAERLVPIMTDAEVDTLLWDHYQREAQTLASQAEASLLKLREIAGQLTPEQTQRWAHIKRAFQRNLLLRSAGDQDPVSRVLVQLSSLTEGIGGIQKVLASGPTERPKTDGSNGEIKTIQEQLQVLKAKVESQPQEDNRLGRISQVTEQLAQAQAALGGCLNALNQQVTLRVIDPAQPADYTVTNVDQATLKRIWELVDSQRGAAHKTPTEIAPSETEAKE